MDKSKIYSPNQVGLGTFFGGPLAAVYFLKKNFDAVDNSATAEKTVIIGGACIVALLCLLSYVPDTFPRMVIPIAYTVMALLVSRSYQMTKEQIAESDRYTFQPNGTVVLISIAAFIAFVALSVIVVVCMSGVAAVQIPHQPH